MAMTSNPMVEEHHVLDHLLVLRRRWRMCAAVFLGFVVAAAIVNYRSDPVYRAKSRIVIGTGHAGGMLSDRLGAIEGYFLEQRSFDTQLEVIVSEPVLERAARVLGWIDEGTPRPQRQAAIARLKPAIEVLRVKETRVVVVRAHDAWPNQARNKANALVEAYIAYTEEQQAAAQRSSVAWLSSETRRLRDSLRLSEERLLEYLAREQIDPADGQDEASPTSSGVSESLKAQIAAGEVELARLLERYRERHPRVVDARARQRNLRARSGEEQARQAQEHRKLIQYRFLRRDAELDHEMYQVLLKKLKEADLTAGTADTGIRVLEAAKLPRSPVAPHMARNLLVAAILGIALAIGLAYGAESLDRTVRTPEQILRSSGLPTLAVVRAFESDSSGGNVVAAAAGGMDSETFRTLRTNLRFSHVDQPRRVVLVTSAGPREGKSTVVANLAVSLAQAGRRTLAIDTDLRRPSLHELLRLENRRGLADVLAGDARIEDTILPSGVEGLDGLVSGTLPPNPAEMIESARFQRLIADLRERYEYILLDSPPADGLIDASLLSSLSDGVLFVVEHGRHDARALGSALAQLARANARLYGVVLNKVPSAGSDALARYYRYGGALPDSQPLSPVGIG
jgi:capsular exopolysaccharide synthesis family protein